MANSDLNPTNGTKVGGNSYLYEPGTTPNTRTAISQKSRVFTPHYGTETGTGKTQMGVLGTFNVQQNRNAEPVRGIGFGDRILEMVPSATDPATINFERALLYLCNLWQATGYASGVSGPVRSLMHHRWPFDIEHQLVFSALADFDLDPATGGANGFKRSDDIEYRTSPPERRASWLAGGTLSQTQHAALLTYYEACWFTSMSVQTSKDQGILMESGDASVTDIHDGSSLYGEFVATGNDPSVGQVGSERFSR